MFLDDLWGDFTLAFGSAGCEVLRVLLGHFLKVWPTSYDEPTESWYHIRRRPGPPGGICWSTLSFFLIHSQRRQVANVHHD
jgi:hypothetical protein